MITQLVVYQILHYFLEKYKLTVAGLSKQKALDDDSRTVQQIILTAKIKATEDNTRVIIYYIFEKSKERALQFSENTTKML